MKIVTKTLALSVFMLPALALAAPYGGMGETLISIILILGGVYFILLPYVMTRLVYWILVICLASGKKNRKTEFRLDSVGYFHVFSGGILVHWFCTFTPTGKQGA
ncbi:hypothetical protein [Kingella denitrificans]|uniref:hypothetical protein n=1 Tax=Kingella denitrificans TaxID=502 RepID=UPI000B97EDF6|nr:hypothetical protein [Kingella denitrificans]